MSQNIPINVVDNQLINQQITQQLFQKQNNNGEEGELDKINSEDSPQIVKGQKKQENIKIKGQEQLQTIQQNVQAQVIEKKINLVNNIKQKDQQQNNKKQKKQSFKNQTTTKKGQPQHSSSKSSNDKSIQKKYQQVQKQSFSIPIEQKNRIDKENIEQTEGVKQIQQKVNITISKEHLLTQNSEIKDKQVPITKRSDESQFINWQINSIKSGEFGFDKKNTLQISMKKKQSQNQKQKIKNNQLSVQIEHAQSLMDDRQNELKVKKHKIKANLENNKVNLKLIKQIYFHFCKENNFSAIKSTLFQEKNKSMEQMSLHKWMVFCKQYYLIQKLYYLKHKKKEIEARFQNSKAIQQRKLKEFKQIDQYFTSIFRRAAQNRQKMQFVNFLHALQTIFVQFQTYSQDDSLQSFYQFAITYLHCSNQKECFNKLSHLKLIFAIPQIAYEKIYLDKSMIKKSMEKSRAKLIQTKQQPVKSPKTISKLVPSYSQKHLTKNLNKLQMNPVIKQAKNTLKIQTRLNKNTNSKSVSKNIPKIYQPKTLKLKTLKQKQIELFSYFDSSKDEILDTYFKNQHNPMKTNQKLN